jgi:hypothetical protein
MTNSVPQVQAIHSIAATFANLVGMSPPDRTTIAKNAAQSLRDFQQREEPARAMIGFDGFVDSIISVVDKRHSPTEYDPIATIDEFGRRISAKAGQSSNYELVTELEKLGGNGPIMANAMAAASIEISYTGALGYPQLHPVFQEFADTAEVFSVADPGYTDALEFSDGKLMLGKYESLGSLDWEQFRNSIGDEVFAQVVKRSHLIGMTNWTMLPQIESVYSAIDAMLAEDDSGVRKIIFADLADPAKRTPASIRGVFELFSKMQKNADMVLGLNLSESTQALEVLSLAVPDDPEAEIESTAATIREKLGIAGCVVHPRKGAAAALKLDGELSCASFDGPFVEKPKLSTGAGDNFNAGFCLGLLAGLPVEQCLCTGVGTSGFYVRNARSPKLGELIEFCDELPPPAG